MPVRSKVPMWPVCYVTLLVYTGGLCPICLFTGERSPCHLREKRNALLG